MSVDTNKLARFKACMLLGAAGDAIAYNDGKWEFCPSGDRIQEEVRGLGGLSALRPSVRKMIVSDDTVMHIATAEAILSETRSPEELYCALATQYKLCMKDMSGRAPGSTNINSVKKLFPEIRCYTVPFNPRGGGCGAAMRAVPIGLLYWRPEERDTLVRVAIEAGRMTHNHPTGFLGSMAVALFVSYALQGREAGGWGEELLRTLPAAKRYCQEQRRDWGPIRDSWTYFEEQWTKYVRAMPSVDRDMSATEYDGFVRSVSYMGTGGASGHDAPMIAYEAIRRCCEVVDPSSRWEQLCRYGMFHGGDSDSTGIIAGACYGAMYGLEGVPSNNYAHLEYRERLEKLGQSLYHRSSLDFRKDSKNSFSSGGLSRRERSLDSFRDFPNKKSSDKKRVTFKDETTDVPTDIPISNSRKEVQHDLFSLDSMHNSRNRTRVCNIPEANLISERRSRSHSPPSRMPETHFYSDSFEKAIQLRMANINNHSHFSTTTITTTTTTTKASNLPYKHYAQSKDILKKSDENMTQSPKSFSQPITDKYRMESYIKQSKTDRTIFYPPKYTDTSKLQYKPDNPVAYSYGGYD